MEELTDTINELLTRYPIPAVIAAAAKVVWPMGKPIPTAEIERVLLGEATSKGEQLRTEI